MEAHDPLIGHVIDSKYRLIEQLGRGGMGVVYRAERVLVGDEVALKILHGEFVAGEETVARFRREARAAAKLRHPNVVTIYDYGEARGADAPAYIVMEMLNGESLRDIIRRERRLKPDRAISLMRGICAGIGTAHRRQIVHRDIKPDNIIVLPPNEEEGREHETVKVVDFGIAKLRDAASDGTLTQKGFQPGTVYYMSPEQCRGDELDVRSDVYSLGAMLYEMLEGAPPFLAETYTGIVARHLFDPPPPFSKNLRIPAPLEMAVMRALAKDAGARQTDAGALARELQEAGLQEREAQTGRAVEEERRRAAVKRRTKEEARQREGVASLPMSEERRGRMFEEQWPPSIMPVMTEPSPPQSDIGMKRKPETDPLSLSKLGLAADGANPSRRRSSRFPLMLGIMVLLVVVVAVIWMTRTSNDKNQAPVKNQAPAEKQQDVKADAVAAPAGMVYVPGGEFMMGRDEKDGGDEYERPAHKATVKPFFIDIYEVTREDYKKCVDGGKCPQPQGWSYGNYPVGTARQPVTGVDWDAADAYAKWIGKRLPTEEEWEFAARGADGRRYPWGNEWRDDLVNADKAAGGMADTGTYKGTSPFGAFDMVGSAWEWTATDFKAYPGGSINAQTDGQNLKVIRGNMYKANRNQATTTYRRGWPARGSSDYQYMGFRCAKDITK